MREFRICGGSFAAFFISTAPAALPENANFLIGVSFSNLLVSQHVAPDKRYGMGNPSNRPASDSGNRSRHVDVIAEAAEGRRMKLIDVIRLVHKSRLTSLESSLAKVYQNKGL